MTPDEKLQGDWEQLASQTAKLKDREAAVTSKEQALSSLPPVKDLAHEQDLARREEALAKERESLRAYESTLMEKHQAAMLAQRRADDARLASDLQLGELIGQRASLKERAAALLTNEHACLSKDADLTLREARLKTQTETFAAEHVAHVTFMEQQRLALQTDRMAQEASMQRRTRDLDQRESALKDARALVDSIPTLRKQAEEEFALREASLVAREREMARQDAEHAQRVQAMTQREAELDEQERKHSNWRAELELQTLRAQAKDKELSRREEIMKLKEQAA